MLCWSVVRRCPLQTVQLNLFGLSCRDLNSEMYTRTDNLRWDPQQPLLTLIYTLTFPQAWSDQIPGGTEPDLEQGDLQEL